MMTLFRGVSFHHTMDIFDDRQDNRNHIGLIAHDLGEGDYYYLMGQLPDNLGEG